MRSPRFNDLAGRLQRGEVDGSGFAARVSASAGGAYAPDEIHRIQKAWLLATEDGMVELVDEIHRAGAETAVLSNTDDVHWAELQTWPVIQRLQHRFVSHLEHLAKPDAALFRTVEAALGVSPRQLILFDDNAENVEAARRRGWRAHVIEAMRPSAPQVRALLVHEGVL